MRRNLFQRAGIALASIFGTRKGAKAESNVKVTEIDPNVYDRKESAVQYRSIMHGDAKGYGIRFGTGASRGGKSNRLRLTHNAKLKRRSHA